MTRIELIDFIKSKDSFYHGVGFAGHSDDLLRHIASLVDNRNQVNMQQKQMIAATSQSNVMQQNRRTIK